MPTIQVHDSNFKLEHTIATDTPPAEFAAEFLNAEQQYTKYTPSDFCDVKPKMMATAWRGDMTILANLFNILSTSEQIWAIPSDPSSKYFSCNKNVSA